MIASTNTTIASIIIFLQFIGEVAECFGDYVGGRAAFPSYRKVPIFGSKLVKHDTITGSAMALTK